MNLFMQRGNKHNSRACYNNRINSEQEIFKEDKCKLKRHYGNSLIELKRSDELKKELFNACILKIT